MSDVPSNLIPTRITQLPIAPEASEDSLMMIVYQGNNYQIRVGDLLSVAGVPTTTQVIAGTSLTGGGQLTGNVTLSVATGGITSNQLNTTGVTAGSYGDATNIPVFTVDSKGRITAASTIAATISGYVPVTRQVIAGSGLTGGGALNANVTLTADLSDSLPLAGLTTGSAGVATSISRSDHKHPQVDLSSDNQVTNILGLSHGGTAKSIVPMAGAVVWSGADGLYVSAAGTAGQVLVSGGSGVPTWGNTVLISDQPANVVYAGPASGSAAPTTFRALVNDDLPPSGVTANTYGSSTTIPVITVNSKGVVTGVTTSSVIGTLSYQGGWNASTNVPALVSSVGTNGYYYVVTTAGSTNLNGITDWAIGDWAIFNGTAWQKIDQTNTVTSVNGQTGAVSVGTVTSVGGTGTVNGITLTGTVTSSGSLTLGGTLSGVSLTTQVSGTLPVANGGTGTTTPALVAGTNVTISGTWPNQTINASGGGGTGTVTTVSVVSANGFTGTVANATTTPAITLTTSITGLLKGNGTAISAATSGTDFSAGTSALTTGILKSTTSTGALTIAVAADFPTLNQSTTGTAAGLSATLAIASGGTNSTATPTAGGVGYGTGTAHAFTAAGTIGQVLTSNGSSAPTWATASGGGGTATGASYTNPTAAGTAAAAFGSGASAGGGHALALGESANASGTSYTIAIGWNAGATGNVSTAIGIYSSAGGSQSVAVGRQTNAASTDSCALGTSANASGYSATVLGAAGTASGSYSLAIQAGTASANNSAAIGSNSGNTYSQAVTGAGAMALGGSYASGTDSFAAGIGNNTSSYGAKTPNAVAIGKTALVSGNYSVAIGYGAVASASYSLAIGGAFTSATGTNSFSFGGYSSYTSASGLSSIAFGDGASAAQTGKYAFTASVFGAVGDSQYGKIVLRAATTTSTSVTLTSDGAAASTTNQLIVASGQAMAISGTLIAKQTASGNMAGWNITGIVSNNGGTMAVSGLALTLIGVDSIVLGVNLPTIAVDNTNKGVTITSGYKSATNIRWVATVNTSEVLYA